jgi:TatD DNase family protein
MNGFYPEYIDVHSHLNFPDFNDKRSEIIDGLRVDKILTITVGTGVEDSRTAIALAEKYDHLFATVGIHPTHEWSDDEFAVINHLAEHKKVVAIGECGLDFFRSGAAEEGKMRQGQAFARHIEIALKHDKPLMIHCRSAYDEAISILSAFKTDHPLGSRLRGNMHFFAGNLEVARKFLDLGFTLSFAGPITFARDYDEVIKNTPLESILSETDSPFAAPVPFRGKQNQPAYVKEIVKKIAEIRGEDLEKVQKTLVLSGIKAFRLR